MLHPNQTPTSVDLVRRLVADQLPQWSELAIRAVVEHGTDHALYRIGDDLVARLPVIESAADQVDTDRRWLPRLAAHLPAAVPVPVAQGEPAAGYPWRWSVVPWLPGRTPDAGSTDLAGLATQLAAFVAALQSIQPADGPVKTGQDRGVPLAARDESTRAAVAELGDRVDRRRVLAAWDDAVAAAPWDGPGRWLHGDLLGGNLLVDAGRLSSVIDWGAVGVGDPAADVAPAWSLFDTASRPRFLGGLGCDEDTWRRGRGWALSTSLIALPYYWDTFPAMVAQSHRTITEVLSDLDRG